MIRSPEVVSVPVAGGDLAVGHWGGSGPMVFAFHGITANHLGWAAVAEQLAGDAQLVAPDLRGRGASASLPGPFGMDAHGADMVAVMDHFGVERAVVVGQSMGGYAAVVFAHEHPDRLLHTVLVDGGVPLPLPEGIAVDDALDLVLGPAMARLAMTFATLDAYLDFWRAQPSLGPYWNEVIEAQIAYDLVGDAPVLRSSVNPGAVRGDTAYNLTATSIPETLETPPIPMSALRAERGMFDQVPPLFTDEMMAAWPAVVDLGVVPDVNHYTILLSDHGAAAVAGAIRHALAASPA